MPNLSVNIGKLKLKNPVMVASGTFGYAEEFADFVDLKKLGALVTKTITLKPRQGNPPPRTCETPAGMLNSIGLENPGIDNFIEEKLPFLEKLRVPIIVSIASEVDPEEFVVLAKKLDKIKEVEALELNISCPNIKLASWPVGQLASSTGKWFDRLAIPRNIPSEVEGQANSSTGLPSLETSRAKSRDRQTGKQIAQDPKATYDVVRKVRKVTKKTIITKLSPNVTDIVEIAQAAERAGSNAISLINTLTGMSIDVNTRSPKIATITGGLSGPAIRPVAVRMVWEVRQKIKVPIIGIGGIINASSALEFFIAGATAVAVGTANFINPKVTLEIIAGIRQYLIKNNLKDIHALIGSLRL